LVYAPSRFADPDELVALASAARDAGGARYVTHLRNEGDALLEAVGEAVEIGRRADVAVQCSHHKAWGKPNWGKVHRSLAAIDRARSRGQRVYADVYPYVAAWTDLTTLLREPALDGGRAQILARLRDPAHAAAIGLLLELDHAGEWHDIRITSVAGDRNAAVVGMRIDELARWWSLPPARAVIRLLVEEELDVEALFFAMNEDDVATVLSAEFVCVGSDASAIAVDGPTARGLPHPRAFGCFPRVLSRFVRGRKTLALPEAIRRMTALPAEIFGLRDRGRVAVGAYADLVLFDPERIVDTATYERPFAYPHGIAGVWVNGVRALRDGAQTPARAGRVLRHGG
ncbi:MAG: N-acyl-D-amino-acid deacylase family protein, partial [Vulcanimicrobiaceae bacterium]